MKLVGPSQTSASLAFDLGPGTGAPPATLGGFTMTKIPSPPGDHSCTGNPPPIPTGGGGSVGVSPDSGGGQCIGSGWATWSHGYVGDVYYTGGATSQTITLPSGTGAVYFYVEPNPFSVQTCQATATGSSGTASTGPISVDGSSGAKYIGFYEEKGSISGVKVSCSTDFATGEYGWAAEKGGCPLTSLAEMEAPSLLQQLDLFRDFRDNALDPALGDLYYEHAIEVSARLATDGDLRRKAKLALAAVTPAIKAAVAGAPLELTRAQSRIVKAFATDLQQGASNKLAADLQTFMDEQL
jgi:hypothetical protein